MEDIFTTIIGELIAVSISFIFGGTAGYTLRCVVSKKQIQKAGNNSKQYQSNGDINFTNCGR